MPKLVNILADCVVLGRLLMRWLPMAVRERGDAERYAAELKMLAAHDWLTGLFNRRHFEALGQAELARSRRYSRALSVLILDIDNFKTINDRFGHATGDLTLQTIAAVCRIAKRDSDVVARIGGEEFAVMLPETDEEGARLFAERLCERVRASSSVIDDEQVSVTVSIGIATIDAATTELLHLLGRADEALYEAKRSGRDRVVVSMSKAPALVTSVAV